MDEAKLKAITGGDKVTARLMWGNPFTFAPAFKLLMAGNYRPMRSADDAMRRRFHLIPFKTKPEKLDRTLRDKLRGELGGILKWAIEGAVEWQRIGLAPPRVVVEATSEYFQGEDTLGAGSRSGAQEDPSTRLRRRRSIAISKAGRRRPASM